jgi:hypothetical protein
MPTLQDIESLVNPNQNNPALPFGHPFNIHETNYWSTSSGMPQATLRWWTSPLAPWSTAI